MVVTNPNNWHWVDKNCLDWAKGYFEHKLIGLSVNNGEDEVSINKIKALEGDCEVCQRKGKVISLYDMKLVMEYKSSSGHTGSITIPEVMYDTEPEEYQFELDERVDEKSRILIRSQLVKEIRAVLVDFGPTLINVHGSDIQVDENEVMSTFTKGNKALTENMKPIVKERTTFNKGSSSSTTKESKTLPKYAQGYNITKLHFSTEFNTSADQIYLTLLDPQRVSLWTRGPPDGIEPKEGAEFRLFGGGVEGKVIKLEPNRSIEMFWRLSTWKPGHYVKVVFTFDQGQSETRMEVDMNGVPVGQEEVVRDNFEEKYIRAIKLTFGFGAVL